LAELGWEYSPGFLPKSLQAGSRKQETAAAAKHAGTSRVSLGHWPLGHTGALGGVWVMLDHHGRRGGGLGSKKWVGNAPFSGVNIVVCVNCCGCLVTENASPWNLKLAMGRE
jgi:hypothetical protein